MPTLQSMVSCAAGSWVLVLASFVSGCGAPAPLARHELMHHTYAVGDPHFARVMGSLLGPPIVTRNLITTLVNGDEFYPAQLEAIRAAQHSITLETHIFWSGDIGKQFTEALAERARAGVQVHVILDAIGSERIDRAYIKAMEAAGAKVVRYHPIERLALLITIGEITQRTHRKLLIVDGTVGFTGGAGIADVWRGDGQDAEHWRDTFYRVEGPLVAQLQAAFADNWLQAAGEILDGPAYFPPLEERGPISGHVFMSSPEGGSASMELMYLLAINAAEETIDIGTPYFVPDASLLDLLKAALGRGVRIRLIVPGPHMDQEIVRVASRGTWQPLLEAGMEIYEYQPTMYHTKLMVIDGLWSSVGSANLDPLSFRLNDEANLNVVDADFAQRQLELFEEDLARSKRITEAEHEKRSIFDRIGEFFAWLLKPVL